MLKFHHLEEIFEAVGELLQAKGEHIRLVVVGGASMNLLGFVNRTTDDVDVIARAEPPGLGQTVTLLPPDPLPDVLQEVIATVARDFSLPEDWMNTEIGAQWRQGLPPWLGKDLTWRRYQGLTVGLVGRRTLMALKLFAAVDQGSRSVHYQDLVALSLAPAELEAAAEWVMTQDASEAFAVMLQEVIHHVNHDTGRGR